MIVRYINFVNAMFVSCSLPDHHVAVILNDTWERVFCCQFLFAEDLKSLIPVSVIFLHFSICLESFSFLTFFLAATPSSASPSPSPSPCLVSFSSSSSSTIFHGFLFPVVGLQCWNRNKPNASSEVLTAV